MMNYLVIEGYKEAAEKLAEESGVDPGIDLSTLSDRTQTRVAIERGDIQDAIERANELDPSVKLPTSANVLARRFCVRD